MWTDRVVSKEVCRKVGHHLVSLKQSPILDPATKTLIPKRLIVCQKCGLTPEQIAKFRPKKGVTREPKYSCTRPEPVPRRSWHLSNLRENHTAFGHQAGQWQGDLTRVRA